MHVTPGDEPTSRGGLRGQGVVQEIRKASVRCLEG